MLFNSVHFLVFFPIAVAVHFLLRDRYRWMWLLAASYYFYMSWRPGYVLVIIALTLLDFVAAIRIAGARSLTHRKVFLATSLVANIGLLAVFKYFDFFNDALVSLFGLANVRYVPPALDLVLPVGISFHTFQAMSYTIDVYRGRREPERHLGYFALFVAFFPQLVAGPIERAGNLLRQIHERHDFNYTMATDGLRLMLWGFFKKLVVADRVAVYVNAVYDQPSAHSGLQLLVATYLFAYQIYCDFSGYSDIAVGSAKVLGYNLSINFSFPYAARGIADFWHRWHISLSTWFRDYLYVPLGGNRVGTWKLYRNILVVFVLSGLWHGANWTFVAWGALHGIYLIAERATQRARVRLAALVGLRAMPRLASAISVVVTFHLVLVAWVFFRAASVSQALTILSRIVSARGGVVRIDSFGTDELVAAVVAILVLEGVQLAQRQTSLNRLVRRQPGWIRWSLYYAAVVVILLFGRFDEREFIYFQF
jgi:alginate O-acetyltransferase complex protein AlgI